MSQCRKGAEGARVAKEGLCPAQTRTDLPPLRMHGRETGLSPRRFCFRPAPFPGFGCRLNCPWVASECDAVIAWLPCGHEAPCLSFLRGMPGTLTTRKLRLCSGGGSRGGAELRRGDRSYAYGRAVPLWTPVSCSIISVATVCFAYIVCCTRTVRSDLRICDGMMTHQVGSSPSLEQ